MGNRSVVARACRLGQEGAGCVYQGVSQGTLRMGLFCISAVEVVTGACAGDNTAENKIHVRASSGQTGEVCIR